MAEEKRDKVGVSVFKKIVNATLPKRQPPQQFISMDNTNMLQVENQKLRQRVHELEMKLIQMGQVV